MNLLGEIASELFGMFITDARLTVAILSVIASAAIMIRWSSLPPLLAGIWLLAGCIAVLLISVRREAVRRRADASPASPRP